MSEKPKIIVSGSIAKDRIRVFPGSFSDVFKPESFHKISVSFLTEEGKETYGGVAANICYTLALLGENPVLLGSMGKEAIDYIERLAALGIETQYINLSDLPTADFTVITDKDNNQIGAFYPGAMNDHSSLVLDHWKGQNALAIISPYTPEVMDRQVQQAINFGLSYVYDPGQQIINIPPEELARGISNAEIVIVNDYELGFMSDRLGQSSEALTELIPILVTTYGKEGSTISGKSVPTEIQVPAVQHLSVVDPTGAGDAYRAGFLYGYIRKHPLEVCGRLGSLTAAYAIEREGAQEHSFSSEEFKQRYISTYGENLE